MEHVVQIGLADPDRLGIGGWMVHGITTPSYKKGSVGAYLAWYRKYLR